MKYFKKFNEHSEYLEYINSEDKILPNISYCQKEEDIHVNPWELPYNIIMYRSENKLLETTSDKNSGFHPNKINANLISHEFENGVGTIKIDKDPGKYKVKVTYDGNDKYKASNATKTITVEEKEEVQEASSSSSSSTPSAYAYKSDGTPMYSQAEVDSYMHNKYGNVNYHIAENGYMDMDQPGYDDAGHWIGYR